jgi:hypothetical protein
MVSESNFVVRVSGRMENSYYIDYLGAYKVMDIAKIAGVEPAVIKEIYLANGAEHDGRLDVFYFGNMENAKKAARANYAYNLALEHFQVDIPEHLKRSE